jgi:hypothetical protein
VHYCARPFLRRTRFAFRIQRRRSFGSKTTRGHSLGQFREANRRWNALSSTRWQSRCGSAA